MMKQLCPICQKTGTCRIAPNGKRGYCKTRKKRWKLERVPTAELAKMQPGPIQHKDLIPFEEDLMRWSYRIVGHYVQDTLEQWELGFTRDMDMQSEVACWHRLAFAFITWHRRTGTPLRDDATEGKLVAKFVFAGTERAPLSADEESKMVRQCWDTPDDWGEDGCLQSGVWTDEKGHKRWAPPEHLKDWPAEWN